MDQIYIGGVSCYLFSVHSKLRVQLRNIIQTFSFELFIMICIIIMMIILALDEPSLNSSSNKKDILNIMDTILSIIFIIEAIIKIIVMGFVIHPNSYLRNKWNQLDFFVVLVSIIDFIPYFHGDITIALKATRAFRPLRIINKLKSLKLVVTAMVNSLPGILHVTMVSSCFY